MNYQYMTINTETKKHDKSEIHSSGLNCIHFHHNVTHFCTALTKSNKEIIIAASDDNQVFIVKSWVGFEQCGEVYAQETYPKTMSPEQAIEAFKPTANLLASLYQ